MAKKPNHFFLFSSISARETSVIDEMFRSLGFYTEAKALSTWSHQCSASSIFIIDGSDEDSVYELIQTKHKGKRLSLAIFVNSEQASLRNVFDYFEDFVIWPCEPYELGLRMDRLGVKRDIPASTRSNIQRTMIGSSPHFKIVLDKIARISACDVPVLISGETGTGKELAARAIHYQSQRSENPFIPVNCGALPDTLLENELFGHEKGAYTDARTSHEGLVSQADGGTLFLDEIDALSPKAQVTLLRFLQEKEYRPLGGGKVKEANIRIIAASNKVLQELVSQGLFRDDLYFRLDIIPLRMPALRERREDIHELAEYFMDKFRSKYEITSRSLSNRAFKYMDAYSWPGNIRELESVIHRSFLMATGDEVTLEDTAVTQNDIAYNSIEDVVDLDQSFNNAKDCIVNEFEKFYLHKLMTSCQGNVTLAARQAGKERRALGKLLKKHGINKQVYI